MTSLMKNNFSEKVRRVAWFYIFENLFGFIKDNWSFMSVVLEEIYKEILGSHRHRY